MKLGYLNREDRETLIAMTGLHVWLDTRIDRLKNKEARKYARMARTFLKKAAIITIKEVDEKLVRTLLRQCRDYEFVMQPTVRDTVMKKSDLYHLAKGAMAQKCMLCMEDQEQCELRGTLQRLGIKEEGEGTGCPYEGVWEPEI